MSQSSKSKSKDKKTGKEASKTSSKSSNHVNTGAGVPANGYNPLLGTFHTVDTAPFSTPRVQVNGRYQTIEETDDRSVNSFGTVVECDSISNNGSWSGESEDKDKLSQQPLRQEAVPPGADNDKREKVRQKNEKKHQRQKERRFQELRERCSSYLTSRKLKALAQQLVSMGFSEERATMALIHNEGRVEESVAWLFEEGEEEADKTREQNIGNKKIDISEELARIAEMEIRCKCSRQEVERAVVACEGDLEKAEEFLRAQREDPPSVPPKPDRTDDPPLPGNNGKLPVASNQNLIRIQLKTAPGATILQQQQRYDRDFNYTKLAAAAGPSVVDPGNRHLQSSERIQPKPEWAKPQHISVQTEKRWPVAASGGPASLSPALHTSAQPTKSESGYVAAGSELKNHQVPGSVREPPSIAGKMASGTSVGQSVAGKMASSITSVGSASVDTTAMGGWSTINNGEILKPNGFIPSVSETRTINSGSVGRNQFYNQFPSYHQPSQGFVSNGITLESMGTSRGNGNSSLTRNSASPMIAAASSLGLFSAFGGSGGSSSSMDWNSGGLVVDYTNIDWSLERGGGGGGSSLPRRPSSGGGGGGVLWPGMMNAASSMQYDTRTYDTYTSNMGGVRPPPPSMMRTATGLSNGSGFPMGLQGGVGGGSEMSTGGSRDWASPFEERDIFSLQRNFASSPSVEHLGEYLKKMNNK